MADATIFKQALSRGGRDRRAPRASVWLRRRRETVFFDGRLANFDLRVVVAANQKVFEFFRLSIAGTVLYSVMHSRSIGPNRIFYKEIVDNNPLPC